MRFYNLCVSIFFKQEGSGFVNKNFLLSKDELKKNANAKTSEEKEKLKKHYTNVFYNELVKYNTILSDEEFYEFCNTYISNVID